MNAILQTSLFQAQDPPADLAGLVALLVLMVFLGVCVLAFFVSLAALMPGVTRRSELALIRWPKRAFVIGLVNYFVVFVVVSILGAINAPVLGVIGLILLLILLAVTAMGLAGMAVVVGQRVDEMWRGSFSPLAHVLVGTLTLTLASAIPGIGQVFLLLLCFEGAGVGILSSFSVARPAAPAPVAEEAAPIEEEVV
ncbi:MAG: hypothetical protein KKA73_30375 [Chloroflexi bacterium]|nr:hypothetical protein [Chloroflexota bacterium]MBU1752006.1 hypothetical protein [Chloroflexota bacterium]MBU1879061.1 hypothetical protein [Chloroflexota bacterium]